MLDLFMFHCNQGMFHQKKSLRSCSLIGLLVNVFLDVERLKLEEGIVPIEFYWAVEEVLSNLQGATINNSGWIYSAISAVQFKLWAIASEYSTRYNRDIFLKIRIDQFQVKLRFCLFPFFFHCFIYILFGHDLRSLKSVAAMDISNFMFHIRT